MVDVRGLLSWLWDKEDEAEMSGGPGSEHSNGRAEAFLEVIDHIKATYTYAPSDPPTPEEAAIDENVRRMR